MGFKENYTRAAIMLRINVIALAVLVGSAISAAADNSGCTQVVNLSAARLTWAALRKDHVDPLHSEESCRSYAQNFFAAVAARQVASVCKEGTDRERTLELLDGEIGAFNDLIAARCNQ